jgi:hypothetical protein
MTTLNVHILCRGGGPEILVTFLHMQFMERPQKLNLGKFLMYVVNSLCSPCYVDLLSNYELFH